MGAEKRRSDRYAQALPVEIHDRRGTRRATTVDVGRHGIYVELDDPPPDRMLLRLTVHLPEGPIPVLAAVVRRKLDDPPGVGLQFFAIEEPAKERWDRFIARIRGERLLPPEQRAHVRHAASFVVRLTELDRLRGLHTRDISVGGVFLVSPVLRRVGSEVNLVFVHPITRDEFHVPGAVVRVRTEGVPGMGIRLHHFTEESKEAFRRFLDTGLSAAASDGPPPEAPPHGVMEEAVDDLALPADEDVPVEMMEIDPLDLGTLGESSGGALEFLDVTESNDGDPANVWFPTSEPADGEEPRARTTPPPPPAEALEEAGEGAGLGIEWQDPGAEPEAPAAPQPSTGPVVLAEPIALAEALALADSVERAEQAAEAAQEAAESAAPAPFVEPISGVVLAEPVALAEPITQREPVLADPFAMPADAPPPEPVLADPVAMPAEAEAAATEKQEGQAEPVAQTEPVTQAEPATHTEPPAAPVAHAAPPATETATEAPPSAQPEPKQPPSDLPRTSATPGPRAAREGTPGPRLGEGTPGPRVAEEVRREALLRMAASRAAAAARQVREEGEKHPAEPELPGGDTPDLDPRVAALVARIGGEPDRVEPRLQLAAHLIRTGRSREAATAAAGAVSIDPRHPIALGALARALLASGRPAEAEGALRRARKAGFLGDEGLAAEIARALRATP